MKKIKLSILFTLVGLMYGYSQTSSELFSDYKKMTYFAGYSSIQFKDYSVGNFIKYNNSSAVNLGIDYRFSEKKNYQFTAGAILNYSTVEYRINNNFTDTGTELFLEVPVKFEYNIALSDKFYFTPGAGLNFSAYLNSEQKHFQNYFYEGGSYETMVQTQPYSISGVIGVGLNYKTTKGIIGLSAGYAVSLNNVYSIDHISVDNDFWSSQSLKRKYVTLGLKFTPKK